MTKPSKTSENSADPIADTSTGLHDGIVSLLEAARRASARCINAVMTASYWEIGRRLVEVDQGGKARAAFGSALVKRLGDDLTRRF